MRSLVWLVLVGCGGNEVAANKPAPVPSDAGVADAHVVFESVTGDGKGGFVVTQVTGAPEDHDKQIIKRVVHTRHKEIMACAESERVANPSLEGTVRVTFTIGPTGDVVSAAATGMTDNLDRCIEGEFRQLKFPKASNGKPTTVNTYPLVFKRAS